MSWFVQGVLYGLLGAGVLVGFGACVMVFIMIVSFAVWCLDRDKIEDEETEEEQDDE
jgi:hypothetical protein